MPVISRIVSIFLRVGEIAFGAVVAGVVGHYLREHDSRDSWPGARWIYTEVVAGVSILLGLLWLIPFASGFTSFPLDIVISLAWFASFGTIVHSLKDACDSGPWHWGWESISDGSVCSRWQAAAAFAFLSAVFWLVSAIVGIWFTSRTRRRDVAGDGVHHHHRRPWYRRHAV